MEIAADILFVLVRNGGDTVYGGERSTILSARILEAQGVKTHFLVTAEDGFSRALKSAGLTYDLVPVGNPFEGALADGWLGRAGRVVDLLRINARIFGHARGRPGFVVHTTASPGLYCALLGAKASGAACIWHLRDLSRQNRTRWFEAVGMLLADRTIAISDSLRGSLVETAWSPLRPPLGRRIDVVYNAFDFDEIDRFVASKSRAECAADVGLDPARLNAMMVGAIGDKKGQLRFLERVMPAVRDAVPELLVTFIGGVNDAAYMRDCEKAIERAGLSGSVRWAGYRELEEVYAWYRASDLALISSDREGLSRFAVEAHAFGLPVVSTRIPGPMDVVEEGTTGYLVSNDHIEEMGAPIVALARDAELRRRLGAAGSQRVRARFSMAHHRVALLDVYRRLGRFMTFGGGAS